MEKKHPLITHVAQHIRKKREALGYSQEAFADYVNINRANYGAIERGERNISLYTICRLAKAMNCEPAEFLPTQAELKKLLGDHKKLLGYKSYRKSAANDL